MQLKMLNLLSHRGPLMLHHQLLHQQQSEDLKSGSNSNATTTMTSMTRRTDQNSQRRQRHRSNNHSNEPLQPLIVDSSLERCTCGKELKDCTMNSCELCKRLQCSEDARIHQNEDYEIARRGVQRNELKEEKDFGSATQGAAVKQLQQSNKTISTTTRTRRRRHEVGESSWLRCAASVVRWDFAKSTTTTTSRQQQSSFCPKWLVSLTLLLLMLTLTLGSARAEDVKTDEVKTKVCQSTDIRNKVSEFSKLKDCRVVEGFVQILLIDQADEDSFKDIVFPELIEITGYLMLYRVQGLRSIGHLFPNLTVIRGHQLFVDYALVAFEMTHLQEVGLHSLTDVMRGSVRFEKNPVLCYVDTIDWDLIAKNGKGEHVIAANTPKNECPVCEKDCPTRLTKPDEKLCWNKQHCQKICGKCGERACTDSGECCHPSCLGGCSGPTSSDCHVCRDVIVNDTQCVDSCPPDTYEYLNRRCTTERECRDMKKPREIMNNEVRNTPYKPFGNRCILDCPPGYQEVLEDGKKDHYSCKECNGPCFKECAGGVIDNIATIQGYRGCTYINGSLEIVMRDGHNVVKELEDSLSDIEIITGYLKIFRSYPLISLNFLKNLTEIRGEVLDMTYYTLTVLDNQNLQELWNWTQRKTLKILAKNAEPKVAFHYNPKLCLQTIEELRIKTNLKKFTNVEVSSTSNGDKVACNITELRTKITTISSKAAIIAWEPFNHYDKRSLLGYVVYMKEAPVKNVSMYESRDACGGDGWKITDVGATPDNDKKIAETIESLDDSTRQSTAYDTQDENSIYTQTTILTALKPYTQYAYYVKTYTISTERLGAQSKMQYFTTLEGTPSPVRSLTVYSNASDTLVISWLPPAEPNSNLIHYKVTGRLEEYDTVYLRQRNYCEEPISLEHKPVAEIAAEEKRRAEQELETSRKQQEPDPNSCSCQKREPVQSEKDVYNSILFENALQNQVYIKRNQNRRRRDISDFTSFMLEEVYRQKREFTNIQEKDGANHNKMNKDLESGDTAIVIPNSAEYFEYKVPATNLTFVIRNLHHFGKYNIRVRACRSREVNDHEPECSAKSMKLQQTLRLDHADDIPSGSFGLQKLSSNDSSTMIKLQWNEPVQPNGVIVAYQIEYKRVSVQTPAIVVCTTTDQFKEAGYSYTLPSLPPGNYSVRVRATSFAGHGAYTELKYFVIPELNLGMSYWQIILVVIVIIISCVAILFSVLFVYKKKFMHSVPSMRLIATVNPEYVSSVYIPDEWEVPRKKIQLIKELGNGSFGMVYEGIAKDVVKGQPEIRCAVKTVNEHATDRERIEFLNEASVMKGFNTHHVVRLLGVVSQGQPTLVVMELVVNGDLKSYLRSHRPDACENFPRQPPTLKRILQMAAEIADGMAYLAAKKFVHRDLAARNCMVSDDLTVKIGDFGMTRDVYETDYYRKGTKGLLPVRWMAPESLKDGVFTSFSDVWSYGVVLWEMVTLASQPYQGLSNDQVLRYVIEGGVMEGPVNCPDSLYELMRQTWNHKATKRPTFIDIEVMLLPNIDVESFERVSFYHSPEGVDARNLNNSQFRNDNRELALGALNEEELEEEVRGEDSPLRQDFGQEFSSFEPMANARNGASAGTFNMEPFTDNPAKPTPSIGLLELNSSRVPLRAGFEDFEGGSVGSVASSKDTLNLPFVEDNSKSVKNSPFIQKKSSSKGNVSQSSAGRSSLSPQSPSIVASGNRPNSSLVASVRSNPEYENRSPEAVEQQQIQPLPPPTRDISNLHVSFPSIDAIDSDVPVQATMTTTSLPQQIDSNSRSESASALPVLQGNKQYMNKANDQQQQPQQAQQPPLNDGYIGGAAT